MNRCRSANSLWNMVYRSYSNESNTQTIYTRGNDCPSLYSTDMTTHLSATTKKKSSSTWPKWSKSFILEGEIELTWLFVGQHFCDVEHRKTKHMLTHVTIDVHTYVFVTLTYHMPNHITNVDEIQKQKILCFAFHWFYFVFCVFAYRNLKKIIDEKWPKAMLAIKHSSSMLGVWCVVTSQLISKRFVALRSRMWMCRCYEWVIDVSFFTFVGLFAQGVLLLEELATRHAEGNRDYIYYLAIGNARLKQYSVALKYCKAFLQIEPHNQQAIGLEVCVFLHVPNTYNMRLKLIFRFICYHAGAHTEENGEGNNDRCGCGRWCRTCAWRLSRTGIRAR